MAELSLYSMTGFFIYQIQDLQYPFSPDYYSMAGISRDPVAVEGGNLAPDPTDIAFPVAGNEYHDAPKGAHKQVLMDPGTYTIYAWAMLKDGRVFSAGSGTVTVYAPASILKARVYTGSRWEDATPYIYTGSRWEAADDRIYTGSGWE